MTHILDNPIWAALITGNKNIAMGTESVKFYPSDVSPFAGIEQNSSQNLLELYKILPVESAITALVNPEKIDIPEPWSIENCVPLWQMVCDTPIKRIPITETIVDLSFADVQAMLELTSLTHPGPFKKHTIDYGHYRGIFDGGKLVAMSGQRMHAPPYAEISAVCTHPNYLGRGFAAQLILDQVDRIIVRGEIPFLHVAANNEKAIKLYESLGFINRRNMYVYMLKK